MNSKKLPVAINVFPSLDYVELVQFDEKSGEIEKASSLPCQFDTVSRQIGEREQMTQTIRDLFNMNRIPFSTPTVLVLPSFFTREIDLPAEFTRDELRFALVSEAERFYVFKKSEPQIDWINLDESRLLYSAFPRSEIEKYMKVFQELRIPLLGIELSYFSILRGLVATGAAAQEVERNETWAMLVVSDYSFFASVQQGMKILRSTDAPLSVTMDDDLATIQEIIQDFESFTERETFSKLIVVNNANRINSDDLLCRINFPGSLIQIDQNALTLRSRGASEAPFPCSLESIGGVFYKHYADIPGINFQLETGEDLAGILQHRQNAMKWLIISNVGIFLLSLLTWGIMALLIWQKDMERESITAQMTQLGAAVDNEKMDAVNRKKFIKKVVGQNVQVNNFLVQLGTSTQPAEQGKPPSLWLDKVQLAIEGQDKPPAIILDGKAIQLDGVNALLTPLNNLIPGIKLQVSNAAPATSNDGQAYFTWTVQNEGSATAPGNGGQPMPPGGG